MKAEELMIGDWVLPKNETPIKLHTLGFMNCMCMPDNREVDKLVYSYKDIEPIPITEEILEKNGFKLAKQRRNARCFVLEEESYRISFTFFDTTAYDVDTLTKIDAEPGTGMLNKLFHRHIIYVHQLQHAMRLWGIEKEIEV